MSSRILSRSFSLVAILILASIIASPISTLADEDEEDRLFHEGIQDHGQQQQQQQSKDAHLPMPKDKLLLSEVKTLTFTRNKRTTSRRTHSIHQLSCVGGTAGCKLFTPNVVECHNGGLDKTTGKLGWRCRADMSDRVRFNHVEVICEGYDYPEDDYILLGSCGLEFTLDYADPHDYHDQSYFRHMDEHEKAMHHERVRSGNKPPKPSTQSVVAQWFYAVLANHSLLLIMVCILLFMLALIRSGLYSSSGASAATTSSSSRGKRQPSLGSGGGGGTAYGPLTSAMMSTKKAC